MYVEGLLRPGITLTRVTIGRRDFPMMLMSYLGAVKGWIYWPAIHWIGYTTSAIRIPSIVFATLALFLFAVLLRRISGVWAGIFLIWMLATDVTFLATATFDWGPVVLQHFLLALLLISLLNWQRTQKAWWLFAAGLAAGLGLWDKALFIWNLSSMILVFVCLQYRFLLSLKRRTLISGLPLLLLGWRLVLIR